MIKLKMVHLHTNNIPTIHFHGTFYIPTATYYGILSREIGIYIIEKKKSKLILTSKLNSMFFVTVQKFIQIMNLWLPLQTNHPNDRNLDISSRIQPIIP